MMKGKGKNYQYNDFLRLFSYSINLFFPYNRLSRKNTLSASYMAVNLRYSWGVKVNYELNMTDTMKYHRKSFRSVLPMIF